MKNKKSFLTILALVLLFPIVTMLLSMSVFKHSAQDRPEGPCDIYEAGGTPCVAAHSTTRALYASYDGPLYQVMRQSDGKTLDIGIVPASEDDPGGYANAMAQDDFCKNALCWISKIYDQSGKGNDLMQAAPGTFYGPAKGGFNNLPIADMAPITIGGHKVYGVYIMPGMGLRNNNARDLAINDEPEGIYYVINGKHYDSGCCFDYGNSSTNGRAVGTGTMETTYYGTATAWGSGNGPGPWIMADMEAGLFSGYNAKKNDVPTIDSWQFVTVVVDGGGGNKWDLRGGNAQEGKLTTFYSGVRPGTPESDAYYPMSKKGGILLGNGGDNGNGSAGTFYEGVMTIGYPTEETTDLVQANIVASKYDVPRISLSKVKTFTPESTQNVQVGFTNISHKALNNINFSISASDNWKLIATGSKQSNKLVTSSVLPGSSISTVFEITSPPVNNSAYIVAKVEWTDPDTKEKMVETISQRVRSAFPVKINEIRFGTGKNASNQFIELYNASSTTIDISNWSIVSTPSEWASVTLATIPEGTKISAKSFYLLGLSPTGLVAPARRGDLQINVRSIEGLTEGQQININGELNTIAKTGTAASTMSTLFIPVSTGPWLNFPVGTTTLPVTNANGFVVGEKIGIDLGGNYEVATVTKVGKAATQTNLAEAAKAGDTKMKLVANSNLTIGDSIIINTGARIEKVQVKKILSVAVEPQRGRFGANSSPSEPGEIEISPALKLNHMEGVDVSCIGTGISFSPSTKYPHKSGDAVQALGSGLKLDNALKSDHRVGTGINSSLITTTGYIDEMNPDQWYGIPLSSTAGSIALMDHTNTVVVDAIVYGSQQSSSSANGTIASPELATLEGDQSQGGCIMVVPNMRQRSFFQQATTEDDTNKSFGRYPDGNDTDSNCDDFHLQNTTTLQAASLSGSNNIKVSSTENLREGQKLIIDSGKNTETAIIQSIGTSGATTISNSSNIGDKTIAVTSTVGFNIGQTISIGAESNLEEAVISSIVTIRRRFGNTNTNQSDSIHLSLPLKFEHISGSQVSGSGIILESPLKMNHDPGTQIANGVPTPGKSNQY